jgi:Amino acid transporters
VRGGLLGVGTAAGLVFFAFAGYARIATLGEEVRNPERTLPRAILIALGAALVTYLLVAVALLVGLGPERLAVESAPLVALVDTGRASAVGVLVRVGAAVAAGSALLTVLIGLSRMELAMARRAELPPALAVVGTRGTPWRADLAGGLVVIVIAVLAGPAAAIAVSACSVLVYYAVINLSALRLPLGQRNWPGWTAGLGVVGCLVLALLLPFTQVAITAGVLTIIWTACTVLPQRSS